MKGFHWDEVHRVPAIINELLKNDTKRVGMTKRAHEVIKKHFTEEQFVKQMTMVVDLYLLNKSHKERVK